jgi:hypothetical protein
MKLSLRVSPLALGHNEHVLHVLKTVQVFRLFLKLRCSEGRAGGVGSTPSETQGLQLQGHWLTQVDPEVTPIISVQAPFHLPHSVTSIG